MFDAGDKIEYRTSAGYGQGNTLVVLVLARVPKMESVDGLMPEDRRRPSNIVNRSPNVRYIVRVLEKNGDAVGGKSLKFPNEGTLLKGKRL